MWIKIIFFSCLSLASSTINAQDIFEAARTGNLDQIKALSKLKKDTVNAVSTSGFNPLMIACYRGQTESAKVLVKLGADVNKVSSEGTALLASVYQNNTELSLFLLKKKAVLNAQGPDGNSALMYAVLNQNVELVQALIKKGADKTLRNLDNQTAFTLANSLENTTITELVKP